MPPLLGKTILEPLPLLPSKIGMPLAEKMIISEPLIAKPLIAEPLITKTLISKPLLGAPLHGIGPLSGKLLL